jgi:hypothetical protein
MPTPPVTLPTRQTTAADDRAHRGQPTALTSLPRPDDACHVPPLLHRDWCDTRQHDGLAVEGTDTDHVADGEHFLVPGKREIGFDGDASGAVTLGSSQLSEPAGEAGRGGPCSPNDRAAGDTLRAAFSVLERHDGIVDSDHGAA